MQDENSSREGVLRLNKKDDLTTIKNLDTTSEISKKHDIIIEKTIGELEDRDLKASFHNLMN